MQSHQKQTRRPSTKVSWLFDELSDNNASDNGFSLSATAAVNKQISKVIFTLVDDSILMAYQINTRYNTYAHSAMSVIAWAL